MARPGLVTATPEHTEYLAPRLRQADTDEMWASHGLKPDEGLRQSLALSSHAWAGTLDDEVVCLFGVSPASVLTGVALPWFVASDRIERHQITFLRHCGHVVDGMRRIYPRLYNWVDARNHKAIEWLKWLGFDLQPAKPHGFLQLPFHKFEMRD